jgi:uncharacterized protein
MRDLGAQELRDIAVGSAVLGTGGGGDPYIGTLTALQALEQFGPPKLTAVEELPEDGVIVFPFLIGSPVPLIEKFPLGPEMQQAYNSLDRFLGGKVIALMPIEIGGVNSMVPLALASLLGVPVVDGDGMGRAYPEVQLVTFTLYGLNASPFALADERGNHIVLHTVDNTWAERIGRAIAVEFGAICAGVNFPMTVRQAKEAAVLGSLSYAERIGRAIREARGNKADALSAVLKATRGALLFRGKIVDVQRRVERGWALGEVVLEGMDEDAGSKMVIQFQNENLVAIREGKVLASVPDLITILDSESGNAITTEHLRYGYRVVALGIPCDPKWRTQAGIKLGGPRHFGYDIDYLPLEDRYKDHTQENVGRGGRGDALD